MNLISEREQSSDDVAQRVHLRRDGADQDGDRERRPDRLPEDQRNLRIQRRRKGLRHVKIHSFDSCFFFYQSHPTYFIFIYVQ